MLWIAAEWNIFLFISFQSKQLIMFFIFYLQNSNLTSMIYDPLSYLKFLYSSKFRFANCLSVKIILSSVLSTNIPGIYLIMSIFCMPKICTFVGACSDPPVMYRRTSARRISERRSEAPELEIKMLKPSMSILILLRNSVENLPTRKCLKDQFSWSSRFWDTQFTIFNRNYYIRNWINIEILSIQIRRNANLFSNFG